MNHTIHAGVGKMKAISQKRIHAETRLRIIQAAGKVFSELGYRAATTREICLRADVNIAAVNYHFRDKLGLYIEILETVCSYRKRPASESGIQICDPERALHQFVVEMFQQLKSPERPAWYIKVMIHELANPTPGLSTVVEHVIRPNAEALCLLVGHIMDRPSTDIEVRLCAHSIIGQIVHYIHAGPVIELLWPEWHTTPNELTQIAEHIANFSIAALKELAETTRSPATPHRSIK